MAFATHLEEPEFGRQAAWKNITYLSVIFYCDERRQRQILKEETQLTRTLLDA